MNAHKNSLLTDTYGRTARYLRLSVTDRCNLRCIYCRSSIIEQSIPHNDVLRYEEMLRIVRVAVSMGIEKIRLTGGEPFARKHLLSFIESLRKAHAHLRIGITTNGTLLHPYIQDLHNLGVRVINISLDSFVADTFTAITGRNLLHEVRANMDALMAIGIGIKINAVALRGVNDTEMQNFIEFAMQHPVDVRFIEFMPMGQGTRWSEENFWPASNILAKAKQFADLEPLETPYAAPGNISDTYYNGPARMFTLKGGLGRFGLITPMSNHFCQSCNRLRVTSDGHIRTCLFADKEYTLRGILRHPHLQGTVGDACMRTVLEQATRQKPLGEALLKAREATAVIQKKMVSIGG